jgi:hypothetical protein
MKLINRMGVVLIALAAVLTASAAIAQQPITRPRPGSARLAANPNAASRVRSRTTAQQRLTAEQDAPPLAEETPAPVEPIEASEARSDSPSVTGEFWDGVGEETGYDGGCCDVPCGMFCRPGLWYASADYLLIRPQFSQGVALEQRVVTTTTNPSTEQPTSTATDTSMNYCFNYNSAFRVSVGYRLIDCGGDIQFTYWRMTGTDSVAAGPAEVTNGSNIIIGQLGCNPQDGQFYNAYTGVTANVFDLDFAKCLAFGGPQGDCECTVCPRWDLRWLAGFRAADVSRYNNIFVTDPNGSADSNGSINARFVGAGPRIGVQSRRYFGPCGRLSVFAKGTQAVLIGDYNMSRIKNSIGDSPSANEVTAQYDSFCRMVPVTDIEVGGTWQVAPFAAISAGWLFQCWWDLGQAENISAGTNFGPLDSSNILGFDGLFVRGELLF